MKKTVDRLLRALHENAPDIAFDVWFWDGDVVRIGSQEPVFSIKFMTEEAAGRFFKEGVLGFGEQYMAGNIVVEGDFREMVRLGMDPRYQNMKLPLKTKAAIALHHFKSLNTTKRSPENISRHYDKGNDFYRLYLDESMTYSCAYYRSPDDSLEEAQQQKYEHVCRKLDLRGGETLLDVGCGWGGMLVYAAKRYGIRGVGCTLSTEQAEYAKDVIVKEGLQARIEILLEDYRNMSGHFDKFVSIGMFEHVGKDFISAFMKKTRTLLKAGGIGLLHTIGKEQDTPSDGWTMKYIFPGGYIPVLDHIVRTMGRNGLVPIDVENLRLHYAATLDEWAKRFETNVKTVEEMFGAVFVRMWRMYLNGCAAAFRAGELRLYQILFTKGLNNNLPLTREHLYR